MASSQQPLPSHPKQVAAGAGTPSAVPADSKAVSSLPFHFALSPRVLPSGTLLTVQLEDSLSSANVHSGDTFTASVASPFTIGGHVVLDRGTPVTGHVESAEPTEPSLDGITSPGYFRLTLTAMTVEGKQVALRTSSLFTRGTAPELNVRLVGVRVQKGRHLTFRLRAPAVLPAVVKDRDSMAKDQSVRPSPE